MIAAPRIFPQQRVLTAENLGDHDFGWSFDCFEPIAKRRIAMRAGKAATMMSSSMSPANRIPALNQGVGAVQ